MKPFYFVNVTSKKFSNSFEPLPPWLVIKFLKWIFSQFHPLVLLIINMWWQSEDGVEGGCSVKKTTPASSPRPPIHAAGKSPSCCQWKHKGWPWLLQNIFRTRKWKGSCCGCRGCTEWFLQWRINRAGEHMWEMTPVLIPWISWQSHCLHLLWDIFLGY